MNFLLQNNNGILDGGECDDNKSIENKPSILVCTEVLAINSSLSFVFFFIAQQWIGLEIEI